jgi:hypothetical protein
MLTFRPYRDGDAAGVAALLEDSAPPLYRWKLHATRTFPPGLPTDLLHVARLT